MKGVCRGTTYTEKFKFEKVIVLKRKKKTLEILNLVELLFL